MSSDTGLTTSPSSWRGRLSALFLLLVGLAPVVNWIPGGRSASWYPVVASGWLSGTAITLGAAVVLAILTKRWSPDPTAVRRLLDRVAGRSVLAGWGLALSAFVVYALVARLVYSGVPLHVDELAQVIQARIFATGRLFLDTPRWPEFQSALHVLDAGGRWYTQFPPGGPLLLVPGVWLGIAWLTGPVLAALSVALYWSIVRRVEDRTGVALGAALVFAFAPFVVFMSGSHMNHVGTLFFALAASWSLLRLASTPPGRDGMIRGVGLGTALGCMATIRPLDAAAFALPAAVWLVRRTVRDARQLPALVGSALGVLVPLTCLAWYNAQTTGSPFLFAYEALWGPEHGLGFHAAPWGDAHTPARGLELVSLYLLRLQTYFLESPVPSLLFASVGFAFWREWDDMSGYWWYSVVVLLLAYWAYWHDGFYLGPRFLYLAIPLLALWTVRGLVALADRCSAYPLARRGVWWGAAVCLAIAVAVNIPVRARQYREGLRVMRVDGTEPARRLGVHNALILVRESWGAQLVPRLWALGVSRSLTELLYRSVDSCVLEESIGELERTSMSDSTAMRRLVPLLRDSARVVPSPWSPDRSERALPGRGYAPICQERVADDQAGFTVFAPLLARPWGSNTYARDLHARDSLLLRQDPARLVYLLRPASLDSGATLMLYPVNRDSLEQNWTRR